jgi:putative nucleotidyltransferase with HDIG domain
VDTPIPSSADELVAVDILTFRTATRDIDFDVYIKLSNDNIAHVFSKSTGLDYKRLAQYIQKDVKELFVKRDDLEAYKKFISRPAQAVFSDPNTPQEKKIATLLNMTEQNIAEIFSQFTVAEDTMQSTQALIKNYVDIMVQSPETLTIILRLVSHGDYLYYHSVAVAIFSMFIAKASGQFNQRMLELVGLGGFLHDIGCTQLPKEVICSPEELTLDQWSEMKSHPKIGLTMLENNQSIPDEVRYIVYQHHEEPSGQGYPNGIRGPVIYYPAKIVALADAFSALISKRPFRPAYTTDKAIQILQENNGKHDRELVQILSRVFLKKQK